MRPLRVTVSGSGRADELGGFLERSEDKKVPHEAVVIVSAWLAGWMKVGEILLLPPGVLLERCAVIVLGTSKWQ